MAANISASSKLKNSQSFSESTQRAAPPSHQEQEQVGMITGIMGPDHPAEVILKVLRKHNGNMDRTVSALIEGDTGDEAPPIYGTFMPSLGSAAPVDTAGPRTPPPSKPERSPPVIDLTADDEDKELSRALQASLEDQGPKFGPSERAPDPNWAVVPSNVEVGPGMSQDDQSLSRAIEASLTDGISSDPYDEPPLEQRIRKGVCPVALRPTSSTVTYAALILHGLFFVPQVRGSIARYRPLPDNFDELQEAGREFVLSPPTSGPAHVVWSLLEIFANMEIAQMSELNVDQALLAFAAEHWNSPIERPGDISYHFYSKLAWTVESVLQGDVGSMSPRLLHFRYGFGDAEPNTGPFDKRIDMSIVKVDVRGTPDANDLLSCLSADLAPVGDESLSKQQVIFQPSDVVAFQLIRDNSAVMPGKGERHRFSFPPFVYLDQFLRENVDLATSKRRRQRELHSEMERLSARRVSLTRHNNRDTLADLRSSLHYYEHVAEHGDDEARNATLQNTAMQLRKTLTRIENELQTIDATITKYKIQATKVFDCPELQNYRYDLRVVLVHDGLYGRSHLYSYVKQKGEWWKTVDYSVTQVPEETVLNDPVGLHLSAGPYFLIYSRAIPEEEEEIRSPWPEDVKNSVKHNNRMFLSCLPPEVAEQVPDINSPPSSPYLTETPSEYTMSSGTVEPPSSRGDSMDMAE